ncbi:MAG: hypothetical protein JXB49_09055 [Bacteroidales bacterium]|nr:hypothetical protein [Bacteroidales bacterium]
MKTGNFTSLYLNRLGEWEPVKEAFNQGLIDEIQAYSTNSTSVPKIPYLLLVSYKLSYPSSLHLQH